MPRRARRSKLRPPDRSEILVPPPWEQMDSDEEAEARASYLHAYDYAGGPPCTHASETRGEAKERCGGNPRPIWEAIRFDPRDAVRREALRAVLTELAAPAWYAIERAETENWPEVLFERSHRYDWRPRPKDGLLARGVSDRFPALRSRDLAMPAADPGPDETGEASQRIRELLGARAREFVRMLDAHAQRIEDTALAGFRVTEDEVVG